MADKIQFINVDKKVISDTIETIFPMWEPSKERVCVMSPHDDDAIIGAGYAMKAAARNGAGVYVMIFCCGNAGYSVPEQKEQIVELRKEETFHAYKKIGIERENIVYIDYPDFSAFQNLGWTLNSGKEGSFKEIVTLLRKLKITRLLVPNHYREHIDHTAVHMMGAYDAPQAGDPIVADWGCPTGIRSVLEYSVWADLSPEDAVVNGRSTSLRANRAIRVPEDIEKQICEGILQYRSQGEIIKGLIAQRAERSNGQGQYIEVYLNFDPRPKLDYKPYLEAIANM